MKKFYLLLSAAFIFLGQAQAQHHINSSSASLAHVAAVHNNNRTSYADRVLLPLRLSRTQSNAFNKLYDIYKRDIFFLKNNRYLTNREYQHQLRETNSRYIYEAEKILNNQQLRKWKRERLSHQLFNNGIR